MRQMQMRLVAAEPRVALDIADPDPAVVDL